MKKYIIAAVFVVALLMLSIDWHSFGGPANHDKAFTPDRLMVASANELKRTIVVATPASVFDRRKNVLWCATFQLAWNETRTLVGEDLHFNPEPPIVSELNTSTFSTNDLDAASYVALAGFVKDGIFQRIHESLDRKFSGAASPHLIPKENSMRPQDILAYAYLFKNLEFAIPFEDLEKPLVFGGLELPTFGMGTPKSGREQMASQVLILDYKDADDFVIELKTKSTTDHLVLAKIRPKETLATTIENAESRTRSAQPQPCLPVDELVIPKFNFDITRNYTEIEGAKLVQIDEKGVRLKSESHISIGCAQAPRAVHVMVFDKPFLVLLKRTNAKSPYFAMWVANPELFLER